ncbi:ANTAR domain-containing protein [Cellulomonas edaphi]|uniref:ANTAR domain-containing protein n=1 Tax=Cellulomonas edaphi TaxID=3053468 RepID=A0ABT7S613_9CELL|nr:ANTAR domain-containing protein [Cellulomons edaphi]MDM7831053.1 ANTAR domain-containing protein [Cellulomons edaphi]
MTPPLDRRAEPERPDPERPERPDPERPERPESERPEPERRGEERPRVDDVPENVMNAVDADPRVEAPGEARVERAAAITELQSILLETSDVQDLVQGVADAAAARLATRAEVTVTLRREGRLGVVASSGDRARSCDEVEYDAGEGPCVEAVDGGVVVRVPDLPSEERWPAWAAAARAAGFVSAAAFPAVVEPGVAVAVNVYSEDPEGWGPVATDRGVMYAAEVARAVRLSLRVAREAEVSQDLRAALSSRAVIDQALGVIMAQNRCAADEAFAILRRASQHRNVKLRDVAVSVVANITGQAPSAERSFVERSS